MNTQTKAPSASVVFAGEVYASDAPAPRDPASPRAAQDASVSTQGIVPLQDTPGGGDLQRYSPPGGHEPAARRRSQCKRMNRLNVRADKKHAVKNSNTIQVFEPFDLDITEHSVVVKTTGGRHARRVVAWSSLPDNPYLRAYGGQEGVNVEDSALAFHAALNAPEPRGSAGAPEARRSTSRKPKPWLPRRSTASASRFTDRSSERYFARARVRERAGLASEANGGFVSTRALVDADIRTGVASWLVPCVAIVVLLSFLFAFLGMAPKLALADETGSGHALANPEDYVTTPDDYIELDASQTGESVVTLTTAPEPAAPRIALIGDTWILLEDVPGMEWRISASRPLASLTTSALFDVATQGGTVLAPQASEWQASPLFEGLNREYHYEFEGRLADWPSIISDKVAVADTWGVPAEPEITARGENWVEVRDASGDGLTTGPILEYTIFPEGSTGPYTWQSGVGGRVMFTGLESGVTYKIRARVKPAEGSASEGSDVEGWSFPATVETKPATPQSPATPASPASPASPVTPLTPATGSTAGTTAGTTTGTTTAQTYSGSNTVPVSSTSTSGSAKTTPATGDDTTFAVLGVALVAAGVLILGGILLRRKGGDQDD